MGRPKLKFPYCRRCLKTRDNPDKWAKIRIDSNGKKHERKRAACGTCGQILAWNVQKNPNKIIRTSVPDNIKQSRMTKSDIKDNLEFWKQFKHNLQRKP